MIPNTGRFTVQITKLEGGPREDVEYFHEADSAALWARVLRYLHEAVSANVVRIGSRAGSRQPRRDVTRLMAVAIVVSSLGTVGCGDGSTSNPSDVGGRFNVMIRDTPFSDAKAVLVTFSEVTAHRDTDAGFTNVPFAGGAIARVCDLKKLETAQDILGGGTLPAGHYTQVRLVVSTATIYFDNPAAGDACAPTIDAPAGRSASLDIPSGEVKLNRQFEVPAGGATTMLLDFDGDRSIRQTGNGRYMMTPVIAVVSVQ